MAHTACITPGCHDEDTHDIDQTTGLCGACSRSATQPAGPDPAPKCFSCSEGVPRDACPKSKRPCGHHCDCSWEQDQCCWCGMEFGAGDDTETNVCTCGMPLSKNPHPDAGDPKHLLNVGAVWVCIPCTVQSRHDAHVRAEGFETLANTYNAEVRKVVEVLTAAGYTYAGKDPAAVVRALLARLPETT